MNASKLASPRSATLGRRAATCAAMFSGAWAEVESGGNSFERQRCVRGRPQRHEPLGLPLKLDQEQDPSPIARVGGPDHVWMAQLQRLLRHEPGGFLAQRREVDLVSPFRHMIADQDLGHAAVGEDRFQERVVHGVSGTVGLQDVEGAWAKGWLDGPTCGMRTRTVPGPRVRVLDRFARALERNQLPTPRTGTGEAKMRRQLTAIVERDGNGYVALCPEVDVASQGDSVAEARSNLEEAVALFFETASTEEIARRQR